MRVFSKLKQVYLLIIFLLLSSNSYATVLRLDYKAIVREAVTPSKFAAISEGNSIDGYFLIDTNVNFIATHNRNSSMYFTDLADQSNFVDGVFNTSGFSFSSASYSQIVQQGVSVIDSGDTSDFYRVFVNGRTPTTLFNTMKINFGGRERLRLDNTNLEQEFIWDANFHPDPENSRIDVTFTSREITSTETLLIDGKLTFAKLSLASPVPVPSAIWLLGTGLIGLIGASKQSKKSE